MDSGPRPQFGVELSYPKAPQCPFPLPCLPFPDSEAPGLGRRILQHNSLCLVNYSFIISFTLWNFVELPLNAGQRDEQASYHQYHESPPTTPQPFLKTGSTSQNFSSNLCMAVLPLGLLSFQSFAWLPFSLQCLARVGLAWGQKELKSVVSRFRFGRSQGLAHSFCSGI